jgi:hypothetical protein
MQYTQGKIVPVTTIPGKRVEGDEGKWKKG